MTEAITTEPQLSVMTKSAEPAPDSVGVAPFDPAKPVFCEHHKTKFANINSFRTHWYRYHKGEKFELNVCLTDSESEADDAERREWPLSPEPTRADSPLKALSSVCAPIAEAMAQREASPKTVAPPLESAAAVAETAATLSALTERAAWQPSERSVPNNVLSSTTDDGTRKKRHKRRHHTSERHAHKARPLSNGQTMMLPPVESLPVANDDAGNLERLTAEFSSLCTAYRADSFSQTNFMASCATMKDADVESSIRSLHARDNELAVKFDRATAVAKSMERVTKNLVGFYQRQLLYNRATIGTFVIEHNRRAAAAAAQADAGK